jgi:hypothetical protein
MGRLAAIALVAAAHASCARPDPLAVQRIAARPAAGDQIVATVDGEPITRSRVEELSGELGMEPEKVLEGLVEMALMAQEAERRGLLDAPAVRQVWKKALVQRILARKVEDAVPEDSVTVEDVRSYYAAHYRDRGILIEDAWRDILEQIVIERRRKEYEALVESLRRSTTVVMSGQTIERALGDGGG